MVFSTFYKELSTYLLGLKKEDVNQVLHVDLWRDNIPKKPIGLPAVFIQIMPMQWVSTGQKKQEAVTELRLHIISRAEEPTKGNHNPLFDQSLEHLEIVDFLHLNLTGWSASVSGTMQRTASDRDRAPEGLLHNVETWRVKLVDVSAQHSYTKKALRVDLKR